MQHAFPVVEILLAERGVESVGVAGGGDVGGGRAFAEHLRDGVSGDQVDQQEDEAHDQPDYRQGVEDALEDSSQLSVPSSLLFVILSGASANALAKSKDPLHLSIMRRRDRVFSAVDSALQ